MEESASEPTGTIKGLLWSNAVEVLHLEERETSALPYDYSLLARACKETSSDSRFVWHTKGEIRQHCSTPVHETFLLDPA